MVQKTSFANGAVDTLLQECATSFQKIAAYQLPAALDRRLLSLSENKERLTGPEQDELAALIEFAEDRTIEKLQAKLILRRLENTLP